MKKSLSAFAIVSVSLFSFIYYLFQNPLITRAQSGTFKLRVLYLTLNPVEGEKNLAEEFFLWIWPSQTVQELEDHVAQETIDAFKRLSNGSISYEVVNKINISEFPSYVNGYQYTFDKYRPCTQGDPSGACEAQKWLFDIQAWLKNNQVCEMAKQYAVDEIWVISPPFLMTYETFMIGPSRSFFVNGPGYIVPACNKHYVVMNPGYNAPKNFLHNYGHRVEATMDYLTAEWQDSYTRRYWCDFAAIQKYGRQCGARSEIIEPYCGNSHFPHNAINEYNYNNLLKKTSTCVDWSNFPDFKGQTEEFDCSRWGCSDDGWHEYWLSSLPRSDGEVTLQDKFANETIFKKNWWYYLLYPENAIHYRHPDYNPDPTITPTQSPTPSPSNPADLDKDGDVDIFDYNLMIENFGSTSCGNIADIDGNCKVDIFDYNILVENFGTNA